MSLESMAFLAFADKIPGNSHGFRRLPGREMEIVCLFCVLLFDMVLPDGQPLTLRIDEVRIAYLRFGDGYGSSLSIDAARSRTFAGPLFQWNDFGLCGRAVRRGKDYNVPRFGRWPWQGGNQFADVARRALWG